jgi:hypothetical protein
VRHCFPRAPSSILERAFVSLRAFQSSWHIGGPTGSYPTTQCLTPTTAENKITKALRVRLSGLQLARVS